MRVRRTLTALLATALLGPAVALGAAAPAAAATETRIVSSGDGPWLTPAGTPTQPGALVFGEGISFGIEVQTTTGEQVYDGTLVVERQLAGESTWTTVDSADVAYLYEFDATKAVGNATYRVTYSGNETYAPTTDALAVRVQRNLNAEPVNQNGKLFIKGKVAPKYAGKPVLVQRKVSGTWKKYSVVRTDSTSRYKARVAAPGKRGAKSFYRLVVKAGGGFVASRSITFVATTY